MGVIIDAEKLQNELFIKKERIFICRNLECQSKIIVNMSDDGLKKKFLFIKRLLCPICGFSYMVLQGDKPC